MIENIHIIQLHPAQALVQAGEQVLAAAPVSIGTGPHFISGLGADQKLVPVRSQILFQNPSKVKLRASGSRSIVICQIKVRDSVIEGCKQQPFHILVIGRISEIVPQAERDSRKLQAALAAASVSHGIVTGL